MPVGPPLVSLAAPAVPLLVPALDRVRLVGGGAAAVVVGAGAGGSRAGGCWLGPVVVVVASSDDFVASFDAVEASSAGGS